MSQAEYNRGRTPIRVLAGIVVVWRCAVAVLCALLPLLAFPLLSYVAASCWRGLWPGEPLPMVTRGVLATGGLVRAQAVWLTALAGIVLLTPLLVGSAVRRGVAPECRSGILSEVCRRAGGSTLEFLLRPVSAVYVVWCVLVVGVGLYGFFAPMFRFVEKL